MGAVVPVRRNTAPARGMKLCSGSQFTSPSLLTRICDIWTWHRLSRSPAAALGRFN